MSGKFMSQSCDYIVVHCTDSPNDLDDDRFDSVGDIHRWHVERGFTCIGYHYVIDEIGETSKGRFCHPESRTFHPGAHAEGYNSNSVGVALFGKKRFHEDQIHSLVQVLSYLQSHWPEARIIGHNEINPNKTCPGFDVQALCKKWELQ